MGSGSGSAVGIGLIVGAVVGLGVAVGRVVVDGAAVDGIIVASGGSCLLYTSRCV